MEDSEIVKKRVRMLTVDSEIVEILRNTENTEKIDSESENSDTGIVNRQ